MRERSNQLSDFISHLQQENSMLREMASVRAESPTSRDPDGPSSGSPCPTPHLAPAANGNDGTEHLEHAHARTRAHQPRLPSPMGPPPPDYALGPPPPDYTFGPPSPDYTLGPRPVTRTLSGHAHALHRTAAGASTVAIRPRGRSQTHTQTRTHATTQLQALGWGTGPGPIPPPSSSSSSSAAVGGMRAMPGGAGTDVGASASASASAGVGPVAANPMVLAGSPNHSQNQRRASRALSFTEGAVRGSNLPAVSTSAFPALSRQHQHQHQHHHQQQQELGPLDCLGASGASGSLPPSLIAPLTHVSGPPAESPGAGATGSLWASPAADPGCGAGQTGEDDTNLLFRPVAAVVPLAGASGGGVSSPGDRNGPVSTDGSARAPDDGGPFNIYQVPSLPTSGRLM